jgi:hypothetical protein
LGWRRTVTTRRYHGVMADTDLELTRDEIVAILEDGARRRVEMTAGELVRAYRDGLLEDPGMVADLLVLAHLLAEDDPLFVAA